MKRVLALLSVLVVFTTMLAGCNLNRVGTDKYYTQITVDGNEKIDKADNGEKFQTFEYKLASFDKDGKEKEMEFTAQKNLRKDAFLCLYYDEKKGVKSWQEVKEDELPKKVKEKLGVK
ncbi:membrane protein [Bacillus manliponensis]|uniref:Membrane protein n=1 Tax=Bacillus manliponensis TaxID=574376 RepID=A0A073JUH5_9BACI|nr:YxeA family protein [Bacillus manliponensis]KEK17831.1 membrane protein [Bacillus manliponensis]